VASDEGGEPQMPCSHCSRFWKNKENLIYHILFGDYKKTHSNLNRGKLWQILKDEYIPTKINYVYKNLKDMHKI
jgi:hypothetical protein